MTSNLDLLTLYDDQEDRDNDESPTTTRVAASYSLDDLYDIFILPQIEESTTSLRNNSQLFDFFNVLNIRYSLLQEKYRGDTIATESVRDHFKEICLKILNNLETKFSFDIDDFSVVSKENYDTDTLGRTIEALYSFFILNRRSYIEKFFARFIIAHRKDFSTAYKKTIVNSQKNIALASLKNNIKDYSDVVLIYCLDDIIKDLLSADDQISFSDVVKGVYNEDGSLEESLVKSLITYPEDLTFFKKYAEGLQDSMYLDELLSSIKLTLLSIFLSKVSTQEE